MKNLPTGWQFKQLDQVSKVVNGGTPKTKVEEYWGGQHYWITPAEMGKGSSPYLSESRRTLTGSGLQKSSAQLIPPWSVILSTRAPIGYLAINSVPMAFNQGCRGLIPEEGLAYKFLYYFLLSSTDTLNSLGTGATFKELSAGKLKKVQIPLPPLPEQKRIVAILDEAFAGIDQAVANTEKNLANAREVFENYLNGVFSRKNDNWQKKKLEELGSITSSKRIYKKEYIDTGVPFYRTKEIKEKAHGKSVTTELYISRVRYDEIKSKYGIPAPGDILLTAIGTIGEIFVVDSSEEFYFKDGNVLWLRDFNSIDSYFLRYVLISFVDKLNKLSQGSAYNALPIQKLKKHTIHLPSLDKQQLIVSKLNTLQSETRYLESIYQKKLTALAELKQSILQKAFTGELTQSPEQELAEAC